MGLENTAASMELYTTSRMISSIGSNTVFLVARGRDGKWYTDTSINGSSALKLQGDVNKSSTLERFLKDNSDRFRIVTIDDVTVYLTVRIDHSAHGLINQFMDCYIGYSKGKKLN
ncbi:MAG: hypothetical protein Q8Q01_01600 [archaeon]|nr:hypothetical protein [archaeon]